MFLFSNLITVQCASHCLGPFPLATTKPPNIPKSMAFILIYNGLKDVINRSRLNLLLSILTDVDVNLSYPDVFDFSW